MTITQDNLKSILHYNPETGVFTRLKNSRRSDLLNKPAGSINKGYVMIKINRVRYSAHRLAWLYMTGALPSSHVDHINHVRNDNRFTNLRLVDSTDNNRNQSFQPRNSSGITGVVWDKNNNKWIAKVTVNNKTINLGRYADKQEAAKARKEAEIKYGFHPNHGKNLLHLL